MVSIESCNQVLKTTVMPVFKAKGIEKKKKIEIARAFVELKCKAVSRERHGQGVKEYVNGQWVDTLEQDYKSLLELIRGAYGKGKANKK